MNFFGLEVLSFLLRYLCGGETLSGEPLLIGLPPDDLTGVIGVELGLIVLLEDLRHLKLLYGECLYGEFRLGESPRSTLWGEPGDLNLMGVIGVSPPGLRLIVLFRDPRQLEPLDGEYLFGEFRLGEVVGVLPVKPLFNSSPCRPNP